MGDNWYFIAFVFTVIVLFCHYFQSSIYLAIWDNSNSENTLEVIRSKGEMNQQEISRYEEESRRIKKKLDNLLECSENSDKNKKSIDSSQRTQMKSLQNRDNLGSMQSPSRPVLQNNMEDSENSDKNKKSIDSSQRTQMKSLQNRDNLGSIQSPSISVMSRRELIQLQDLEYEESIQMDLQKQNFADNILEDTHYTDKTENALAPHSVVDKPEPEVDFDYCFLHSYHLGWP
jgi:hypothetical protein